jgi:hypothetical protein
VAADGGGICKPAAAFIVSALQEMSVAALANKNGRVLRAHLSRVAQASGAYLRGSPVPVAEVIGLEC